MFWRILKSPARPLGTRAMLVTWLDTWSNGRDSSRGLMVEKSGLSGSSGICQQARRTSIDTFAMSLCFRCLRLNLPANRQTRAPTSGLDSRLAPQSTTAQERATLLRARPACGPSPWRRAKITYTHKHTCARAYVQKHVHVNHPSSGRAAGHACVRAHRIGVREPR